MPEGDTVHRAAGRLRPALVGREVRRVDAPRARGRRPKPGTVIEAVEAYGKHLRIRFADGSTLRTHLRMTGSWHLYRTGERWSRPAHLARALVEVDGWVAVCFSAPVVELERDDSATGHLGPDLTSADVTDAQLDEAVTRMHTISSPDEAIAVALLDQRVAAGIGNVYKSEVLFIHRVDPFARVAAVPVATRRALLATAARLLCANVVSGGPRVTYERGIAVYGRERQPCRRCGTPILRRRQGEQARSTYWCPACQPALPPTR
ncbi:MAG: DNA-formamidopyrimidine glycosylase family protein [Acidimicrobiales bacterium]